MVRPLAGGDPRAATAADLDDACRLADALPEVGLLAGPPVRVQGMSPLDALSRCFAATTKHVLATVLRTAAEARSAVRLADAVMSEAPPARPCHCAPDRTAAKPPWRSPMGGLPVALTLPPGPAAAALIWAPPSCGTTPACSPLAPPCRPKPPARRSSTSRRRSLAGLPAAGSQAAMFQIAAAQLAARLRLPVLAGGMLTGSHEPDWQACTQNAFAALSATAARVDVTAGAGTLGGGTTFSLQQLVMDTEIYSWNAMIARGVPVDDETIALGRHRGRGHRRQLPGPAHTRAGTCATCGARVCLIAACGTPGSASGREGAYEKATALARQLLDEHAVVPLPDQVRGAVERIVAEAGR